MNFLTNFARKETWSIAADFNHITHPTSAPTQEQIEHLDPSHLDRISGSILFALSLIAVIPGCFYLYWASRKVDLIDAVDLQNAEGRAQIIFKEIRPALEHPGKADSGKKSIELTPYSPIAPNKLLGTTLLAFGPLRTKLFAQKELKSLEDHGLLNPKTRSFLLAEAIEHNQIDKIELLLGKFSQKAIEQKDKLLSNQELFELSAPIPLHQIKSTAMVKRLISLNISIDEPIDGKRNTALHLISDPAITKMILEQGGHLKINQEGDTPFHTCQNLEVFQVLNTKRPHIDEEALYVLKNKKNIQGETPTITLLSRLAQLVKTRDNAKTIEEWNVLSKQIQDLKKIPESVFTNQENTDISPKNRDGLNAFHLGAQIGDLFFLKDLHRCNHFYKGSDQFNSSSIFTPLLLGTQGLYSNAVVSIKGNSYTCCDIALKRIQDLQNRLQTEKNKTLANKLEEEIKNLKQVVYYTSDSLQGPIKGENNYPLHCLVELEDLELLEALPLEKNLFKEVAQNEVNKQNKKGETPLILALKNLQKLNEIEPKDNEEKEKVDSLIKIYKGFIKFFLEYTDRFESDTQQKKPITDVNIRDREGNSALHLCVMVGDPDLVKTLINHPFFKETSLEQECLSRNPLSMALQHHELDSEPFKEFIKLKESANKELEEENFWLEAQLNSRIKSQEKIASLLISKVCEYSNLELLEKTLENIFKEFPQSLKFIEKEISPLEVVFKRIKTLRLKLRKALKKSIDIEASDYPKHHKKIKKLKKK